MILGYYIRKSAAIVDMDKTYFPESFKGNHKKSCFKMSRPPRKRGKEVKTRGICKEQIYVSTAINRSGNIILELVTKGRISTKDLECLYANRISHDSLICTDSHKSYIHFANTHVAHHYRIARGKHKTGVYHVNSLHSKSKTGFGRLRVFRLSIL